MTAGYSILGSSVEVITYSFDVCKSFKEIYMTFRLSRDCAYAEIGYSLSAWLSFPKV